MKESWRTRAIGRHLVDLPGDALTIESYAYNKVPIEPLLAIRTRSDFDNLVAHREFIEQVPHSNGSVTLVSWVDVGIEYYYFDTYFRAGSRTLKYSGVSPDRKASALSVCEELSHEWCQVSPGELPIGVGIAANDAILVDNQLNLESWRMVIQLAGKPEVSFKITAYTQRTVEPGLRKRAGRSSGRIAGRGGRFHSAS